jgi:hypothetical protein
MIDPCRPIRNWRFKQAYESIGYSKAISVCVLKKDESHFPRKNEVLVEVAASGICAGRSYILPPAKILMLFYPQIMRT